MRKIKELKNKLNEKYYVDFDTFFTAENKNIIEGDFFHNYLTKQHDDGRIIKYKLLKTQTVGSYYINDYGIGNKIVIISKPWEDNAYVFRYSVTEFNKDDFVYSRGIYSAKYMSNRNYYYKDSSSDEVFQITTDDRITTYGGSIFENGSLTDYVKKDKQITHVLDTYCTEVSGATVNEIIEMMERYRFNKDLSSYEIGFTRYGLPFDKYFGDTPTYNVLSMGEDELKKNMFKVSDAITNTAKLYTVYTPDDVSYPIKGYIQEELGIKPKQSFEKNDILHTIDEPLTSLENINNKSDWYDLFGTSLENIIHLGYIVKIDNSMTRDKEVIPITQESLRIIRNYIISGTDLFEADDDTIKKTLVKVKDQDIYYILPKNIFNGSTVEVDVDTRLKLAKLIASTTSLADYLRSKSKSWLNISSSSNFSLNSYSHITNTSPGVVNNKYKKYSIFQLLLDDIPELSYLTDEFINSHSYKYRIYSDTETQTGYNYGRSFYYYVPIDPAVWDMSDGDFEKLL